MTVLVLTAVTPEADPWSTSPAPAPVAVRFTKVARPSAPVTAVRVPPNVAEPLALATVTVTPVDRQELPYLSMIWKTGCCAQTSPSLTLLDGCTATVRLETGAVTAETVNATGEPVSVPAETVIMLEPAVVPTE